MNHLNKFNCNIDLESIRRLPIRAHLYWKNRDGFYLGGNDLMMEKIDICSDKDLLEITDNDLPVPVLEAESFMQEDRLVMKYGMPMKFMNEATFPSGKIKFLTIKTPLFDQNHNVLGVFGFSQYIEELDLKSALPSLSKAGVPIKNLKSIRKHNISENLNNFNLTNRECTCLYYLARGRTAQEIADILFLSRRTAEKHIESIKRKLGCASRSQVCDKAIELGFINFIIDKI